METSTSLIATAVAATFVGVIGFTYAQSSSNTGSTNSSTTTRDSVDTPATNGNTTAPVTAPTGNTPMNATAPASPPTTTRSMNGASTTPPAMGNSGTLSGTTSDATMTERAPRADLN